MRKIILAFVLLLCGVTGIYAQDLALVGIKLSSDQNNNVPIGINSGIEVHIRNNGQTTITAATEISIGVFALNENFEFQGELGSNVPAGDTISISLEGQTLLIDTFDIFSVDASLIAENDTNSANNSLTADFFPSPFMSNDWWCKRILITAPANMDTIDLDNNTNTPPAIEGLQVTFGNIGSIHYVPFTRFKYQLILAGDTVTINTDIGSATIQPGDTINREITNQSILPQLPDTLGTYLLCAISAQVQDFNSTNDTNCFGINIVDNFDPSDPLNWPTATKEEAINRPSACSIISSNNGLMVKANETVAFQIMDIHGKLIMQQHLSKGESVDLQSMSTGVYVLLTKDNEGNYKSKKFAIR